MHNNTFLLYGANGYTGRLMLEMAQQYGLRPILAGRNKEAITALALQYNLPYHIVRLEDEEAVKKMLQGVTVVLNAAGPFKYTAFPLIEACLQSGTHYLDITGEMEIFEMAKQYDGAAHQAGIMVMPGVGFDVVPTDCLALFLQNMLPDANRLKLAFASTGGGVSHGTAMTMLEGLGEGGAVREYSRIVKKPLGHKGFWVDFGLKKLFVMAIPWGDVSTAFHTTGIPFIETYTGIQPRLYKILKWQPLFNWLLRTAPVRRLLKKKIEARGAGPDAATRERSKSLVWGEASTSKGKKVEARLIGPNGYTLTAHTGLLITQKVLSGDFTTGYQTPASAYGADLILEVPGVERAVKRPVKKDEL